MSKFIDKVKTHMSGYRCNKLGFEKNEKGIFKRNGKEHKLGHILPDPDKNREKNFLPCLIESSRGRNLQIDAHRWLYFGGQHATEKLSSGFAQNRIKLHTYFHHLNSSQAMCLNFFYPLLETKQLKIILSFLSEEFNVDFNGEDIKYSTVRFEKPGLEIGYGYRPTSFDFYFQTTSGKKFYFEIKYTEVGCRDKNDKEHRNKFKKVYHNHLSSLEAKYHKAKDFLRYYQVMRNLVHIDKDAFVVFIYPSQNEAIADEMDIAKDALKENRKKHFFPIEWKEMVRYVEKYFSEKECPLFIQQFKEKYLDLNIDVP